VQSKLLAFCDARPVAVNITIAIRGIFSASVERHALDREAALRQELLKRRVADHVQDTSGREEAAAVLMRV
jgi:hypothetical protein